jgi:antitoxin StbD
VTELKRSFSEVLKKADNEAIAILSHNKAEAYLLPAAHYEMLMAYLEDLEDAPLVRERSQGSFIKVSIDDL